ncbi:protein of unknown function [Micromonospora echinaurantiaca]|uniref:DUF202 domain-containing protein n=1 Tax=Micromonospora echinaurantiaca TaxID=47857 RepID=A0A1C5JM55_9ACTN|nr:DUF202 domain-containing protein [Micromonospora echinaurantiaca]SCG71421.1 protein of unknown function [Micromonospora echinaurantiaca]
MSADDRAPDPSEPPTRAGAAGPPARPVGARDPGLQPERTRLAWRRTALTLTVVLLLTLRLAFPAGLVGALLAGAALLGWGAAVTVCWPRAAAAGPTRTGGRTLPLVALATAGFALVGTALVLRGLW